MGVITYQVPEGVKRMTIGVQGEANVREFLFDVTEWRQITGDLGTAEMVVQRRGDSSPYAAAITMHDENTVSWVPTAADTAKDGVGKLQLMWIASGQTVKTKIFDMKVDPALDYDLPDDSLDPWASWMPDVINAAAEIGSLETQVDTRLDSQDAAIAAIRAAVGSPLVANTAAAMTDTEKIYVYTGSESGYTAGKWYYYDGTAWASGGVYNSTAAVETDTTLSVSGVPADAKAAGDEIESVKNGITDENIFNNYTPVIGKYYDGAENASQTYNYYVVPVLKNVKYMVLPKMRMHVIKVGSTNVVIDLTDKKTSFTPTVDGVAYITVYAADTPMLFITNTDKTLSIDGKAADAKTTGDTLFKVENYCKDYNLTRFAHNHILGKYYATNGSVATSATYNYYEKIPVVSGNTYLFTGKVAKYCVLYNNNTIVQTAENVSTFTANYDGDLYVTEYASDPISMYLYNDFFKLDTWTNKNINGKLGSERSNTIVFSTNEGDICHFKLNGYSGQYFTNCLLYAVQSGGNVIVASLYSDTGEYVFIAPPATTYIVYINKSQSETATINFELTNLSKNTIFNSITRHDIINRFIPHIYGKKIACLGDSFTYGVATYVSKLNGRYLSHAINYGVASSRIVLDTTSDGTTIASFLNRYSAMDNDADIITVFGGINDSYDIGAGNLTLGTIDSPLDTNTFYGGLKLLVTNLMKKYPDKQIIGIIPPDCQTGAYYIANLPAVQNAEREVYNMYGIPIIDLKRECYKMSTLPEMVALYRAASDNIHPSGAGQEALCDTISAGIRRIIP